MQKYVNHIIIGALIILGFVLYANSFHNQMFWDDHDGIVNNTYIKDFSNFPKFFSENLIAGSGLVSNYWRPLLLTVFSVEWHLWQLNVFGFHFVNTVFHILCAILIYLVLKRLFRNQTLAFVPALLFLIHPLQTEAVTYISGLADPLGEFLSLLAVWFYMNYRDNHDKKSNSGPFMLSVGLYVLALMTKDSAVVNLGLFGLVEFFYNPTSHSLKTRLTNALKNLYPFIITAAVYLFLRATALNFQNTFNLYNEQNIYTDNFSVRLFTFFKVVTEYFSLLLWPNHLHMERSVDLAHSLFSPMVLVGAGLTLGSLVLAFVYYKKYPILSFAIFWFYGLLFVHSNLLAQTAALLYEHWLYLPMVGFWLVAAWLIFSVIPDFSPRLRRVGAGIRNPVQRRYFWIPAFAGMTILCLILGYKTIARNTDWHDPITFYNQTLAYAPTSYRVINNLGMAYDEAKNYEKAMEMYRRDITIDPNNPVAYHNLGNTYKNQGRIDLAIPEFERAINNDPNFLFSYRSLAQIYLDQKNYDKAIEWLKKLQAANPSDPTPQIYIDQINQLKRN